MRLLYKFTGSEEDRKKFVDPEPIIGKEYTEEEFDKFDEDNNFIIGKFFQSIEVPDGPVNYLTPQMRLEIVKILAPYSPQLSLERIEKYINTGESFL